MSRFGKEENMGACNFITFCKGTSAQDAFEYLVSEAEWEHGHNPYNGTISTTRLKKGHVQVAEVWSEAAREAAIKLAEADGWGEKWESRAVYCGKTESGSVMWAFYGWASY